MAIPRDERLSRVARAAAREALPARGIRPEKQVEGGAVATHGLGEHSGNPADIGAAGVGHGHAVTLDVLLLPTIDDHNAPIGNWPVTLAGATDTVHFVWRVPTEWVAFNSISVVMIPDTEEQIQMDIDVSVSAEGEQYDADERQSLNETKEIAAGDVDDLVEWDILDIGPLFADIAVGDFVTVRLTSDIDGLVIVGLRINYDAGGWSGGGGGAGPGGEVSKSLMFHYPDEDMAVGDFVPETAIRVPAAGEHGAWSSQTFYVRCTVVGTGTNTILLRTSSTLTGARTTRATVNLGTNREGSSAIAWSPADGEYVWVTCSAVGGTAPKRVVAQVDLEEAVY